MIGTQGAELLLPQSYLHQHFLFDSTNVSIIQQQRQQQQEVLTQNLKMPSLGPKLSAVTSCVIFCVTQRKRSAVTPCVISCVSQRTVKELLGDTSEIVAGIHEPYHSAMTASPLSYLCALAVAASCGSTSVIVHDGSCISG
mmetsp:Transcript_32825/g.64666  ORF Transcript_32825/g.64666 Transcript_32825/m.64666 type:complete len:141 (-) Transcript_32825:719-1141(-)